MDKQKEKHRELKIPESFSGREKLQKDIIQFMESNAEACYAAAKDFNGDDIAEHWAGLPTERLISMVVREDIKPATALFACAGYYMKNHMPPTPSQEYPIDPA